MSFKNNTNTNNKKRNHVSCFADQIQRGVLVDKTNALHTVT